MCTVCYYNSAKAKGDKKMKDVVFKRYDEAGKPYYVATRVNLYKRYTRTIKPLNELLKSMEFIK